MDRILRVDMTNLRVREEPYPAEWAALGGRALGSRILLREVDPKCDPLGPDNKVVFAPGSLAGSAAPTSGRMSVCAKSPLTGGIKEANAGGQPGQKLMRLGYRAVVVEGQPKDPEKRYVLTITKDGARIDEAQDLKGLRTYACCEKLSGRTSKRAAFIVCGPAGELRFRGASVALTDQDNRYPTRHAARGGLGAVMGAKGLKAIVVDDEGTSARTPKDPKTFKELVTNMTKAYKAGPQLFALGTSASVPIANMLHTFPTRNRREMQFEDADKIDGARIVENFETRGGGMHNCMSGCIVRCSNVVHGPDKSYVTSALEFETIALMGSNCAVGDIDKIAKMDRLCDELGLDTIETGGAFAVAMDGGKIAFGDADAMIRLLEAVDKGSDELAVAVANGVVATGKKYGVPRIPAVKGQGIPAWEPRTLPATGVTYCTSPMGADHTAGLVIGAPDNDLARASQQAQIVNAVCDSSGFCQFMQPTLEEMRRLFNAMYGLDLTEDDIVDYGWQCLQEEWEFNRKAGFTEADDRLPEWMSTEAVPSNGAVFQVPPEEIRRVYTKMEKTPEFLAMKAVG
ncbi:MAG: aldehyde ferredoxin oxidoreductase [Candidatus Binatia bacterium]|nr:MAG: aldehyde ferredoxin oxidoreductase [Candidatus Binatia bacterium]